VPVFNTRPYLVECLDSLAAQTLSDIEIICVDNGSTDGSYELLLEYASREPRMVVLRHEQGRQGGARNAGLRRAHGAWIGFVDSDDFVQPVMFERLYEAATRSNADVAVCNLSLCSHDGRPLGSAIPSADLPAGPPCTVRERPRLLRNLTICNRLFSREFIEDGGIVFPEGHYHEDQFFVIAALSLARRIVCLPEALYNYRRQRPGSVNETRGQDSTHVFKVMQAVSEFVERKRLAAPVRALIEEVKALRFMQLYLHAGREWKDRYFAEMRTQFGRLIVSEQPQILSSSEYREFRFALGHRRWSYDVYLRLRGIYSALRGVMS